MTAIPIIFAVMVYLTAVGYLTPKLSDWYYAGDGLNFGYKSDARVMAVITTLAFPIGAPLIFGIWLSKYDASERKRVKVKARRDAELTEAQHQARLAELKAKEHEALDRELALLERKQKYDLLAKE